MTSIDNLYAVSRTEYKKATKVLGNAFSEDAIVKKMNLGRKEINSIYEIIIKPCLRYGSVIAPTENLEGVMAFTSSEVNFNMWSFIRSGSLMPILKSMKLLKEMMGAMKQVEEEKKNLNIGPYLYLNVIGVSQESQGKGFGGKLLSALIEKSEHEKKAIYLETQSEENVKFYQKFGFEVIKKIFLPKFNVPMWEMVRFRK